VNASGADISLAGGFLSIFPEKRDIFRRRKLALVFKGNPSSLNELTGYVESTIFHEIWPEYSLIEGNKKGTYLRMLLHDLSIFLITQYVTRIF